MGAPADGDFAHDVEWLLEPRASALLAGAARLKSRTSINAAARSRVLHHRLRERAQRRKHDTSRNS